MTFAGRVVRRFSRRGIVAIALIPLMSGACAPTSVVEDWSRVQIASTGVPVGWRGPESGSDLTVVEVGNYRAMHLRSFSSRSWISRNIKVELAKTPLLEWWWTALVLPRSGDVSDETTGDHAAEVCVAWPRFPALVRSLFICYVWDAGAPEGTVFLRHERFAYVVVRSGSASLGKWFVEKRNIHEDFRTIFGVVPDNPGMIFLSIDSSKTQSRAESYIGAIVFRSP